MCVYCASVDSVIAELVFISEMLVVIVVLYSESPQNSVAVATSRFVRAHTLVLLGEGRLCVIITIRCAHSHSAQYSPVTAEPVCTRLHYTRADSC